MTICLLSVVMIGSILLGNRSIYTSNESSHMPIYRVDREEKWISITFDVNWAKTDYLEDILKILDDNNVKATFFIMGKWVVYPEDNSAKLLAIKEAGHEIGNHSYEHPDFQRISKERMEQEIKKTEEIFTKYGIENSKLFRAPSGSYNDNALTLCNELGYRVVQWDVDSVDWKEMGREQEYSRVIKKVQKGSIILFHNNAKYTPENLSRIIKELREQGYEFKKIEELLYKNEYFINKEGVQKNKL